jgi:hypothetical protein
VLSSGTSSFAPATAWPSHRHKASIVRQNQCFHADWNLPFFAEIDQAGLEYHTLRTEEQEQSAFVSFCLFSLALFSWDLTFLVARLLAAMFVSSHCEHIPLQLKQQQSQSPLKT